MLGGDDFCLSSQSGFNPDTITTSSLQSLNTSQHYPYIVRYADSDETVFFFSRIQTRTICAGHRSNVRKNVEYYRIQKLVVRSQNSRMKHEALFSSHYPSSISH